MAISQTNDTESSFYSNIDRLVRLIRNVLEKGQYSNAEKYIKYLFEVLIIHNQKKAMSSKIDMSIADLFIATTKTQIEDSEFVKEKSIFEDHHIANYSRGHLEEQITALICDQIRPNNVKIFTFTYDLYQDAIVKLLSDELTTSSASSLLNETKYISDKILHREKQLSDYEKAAFLHQPYFLLIDLYTGSVVNTIKKLSFIEHELRELLRQYIDTDKSTVFVSFLESLSSRWFTTDFITDELRGKYTISNSDSEHTRFLIEFENKVRNVYSFRAYLDLLHELTTRVDTSQTIVDKLPFKKDLDIILFNSFKKRYARIIIVEAVAYALFKRKFEFFRLYLQYHNPSDSDSNWLNENYSIGSVAGIIPFLEDYDKLMPNKTLWVERHDITTYINSFIAYYLISDKQDKILDYIKSLEDTVTANVVSYNLHSIIRKNIISEFPHDLVDKEERYKLEFIASAIANKVQDLDIKEAQLLPIDDDVKNLFFEDVINGFYNHATARGIFSYYGNSKKKQEVGKSFGMNQLFPRKAFIKQSNTHFLNSGTFFANHLASNETTYIFSQITRASRLVKLKQNELEDFIKENKSYDVLISKGHYEVKQFFPSLSFEESWALNNPLNKVPGFLGLLEKSIATFLSPHDENSGFLLLKSNSMGTLYNCPPPTLDDNAFIYKDFSCSFIDYKDNADKFENIKERGTDLPMKVWIRLFESIDIDISNIFEGINVEITT